MFSEFFFRTFKSVFLTAVSIRQMKCVWTALKSNTGAGGRWPWFAAYLTVLASCVFNYVLTPYFECLLDDNCVDNVIKSWWTGVYSRSLCISCFVSSVVLWTRYRRATAAYDRWIELHDAYAATNAESSAAERRAHCRFDLTVVSLCVAVIVPVAVYRLYHMYTNHTGALTYFVLMYSHNLIMCMFETRFVRSSYVLYGKFVRVNRDMKRVNERVVQRLQTAGQRSPSPSPSLLVDAIEQLKIRHRLIREAVNELNHAFAVPLVMSLCNLCIMATFDIYYQVNSVVYSKRLHLKKQ